MSARANCSSDSKCLMGPTLAVKPHTPHYNPQSLKKFQGRSMLTDAQLKSNTDVQASWIRQAVQPARALVSRSIMPIPSSACGRVKLSGGSRRTTWVPDGMLSNPASWRRLTN